MAVKSMHGLHMASLGKHAALWNANTKGSHAKAFSERGPFTVDHAVHVCIGMDCSIA